jgi:hypothetical protein
MFVFKFHVSKRQQLEVTRSLFYLRISETEMSQPSTLESESCFVQYVLLSFRLKLSRGYVDIKVFPNGLLLLGRKNYQPTCTTPSLEDQIQKTIDCLQHKTKKQTYMPRTDYNSLSLSWIISHLGGEWSPSVRFRARMVRWVG